MPVKMRPVSQIKARLGIEPNGKVQKFFTHACRVHMDKYVPFDTGTLATTVREEPDAIIYEQPYARYVYYGVSKSGEPLNYQTDKHEYAGPYWDKRMVSAEMKDVVKEVQDYIDRGAR